MVGVLETKASITVVGGEIVIGKEARGNVKFNMLVSYAYRSDDPTPKPEIKTFAFYTVGPIIPREEPHVKSDF
ncbi:hypothetical protein FB451DRAFT_1409710 [Mycena latifolia]|nr:hypothetical protein FB451DRAFT_1409710 [Mycena latifolia]